MNNITISGRLGKKPELKTSENGTEYTNFTVAVERFKKEKDKPAIVDWFSCTAFGKRAAFITTYFDIGSGIVITGRMESSKKDDKTYWTLLCDNIEFGPAKKNGSSNAEDPVGDAPVPGFIPLTEDDIPF